MTKKWNYNAVNSIQPHEMRINSFFEINFSKKNLVENNSYDEFSFRQQWVIFGFFARWSANVSVAAIFRRLFKRKNPFLRIMMVSRYAHTRAAIETRELAYDRIRCYLAQHVIHLITFSLSLRLSPSFSLRALSVSFSLASSSIASCISLLANTLWES